MSTFELPDIPLSSDELAEVSASEERGRRIAHRWVQEAGEKGYSVVDVIVALEVTFAALLVDMDDEICLAESRGERLVSDEDRIALHIAAIRHRINEMREANKKANDDHTS